MGRRKKESFFLIYFLVCSSFGTALNFKTMAVSKSKVIKPLHRRMVEYFLMFKCQLAPTARAVGFSSPAKVAEALDRPEVKAYLEQRMDDLSAAVTAKTTDVIATLNRQMLADMADLLPDEKILQKARKNGVSRNIKEIKITERTDKHGNTTREVLLKVYSSQEAAKSLGRIFGLDSQDELQHARTAIKLYCEMKGCTPEIAILALAPHVPGVIKVKDEFLMPMLTEGSVIDIEGRVVTGSEGGDAPGAGDDDGNDVIAPNETSE